MISPYCFITLDLQWRCFMCKHWSSCTTHILSRRHFAKVRLSEKQKKKKKSCYKVHTHQRCVLSVLHGWNEWSSPPPAEPHLSGLSLFFLALSWTTWAIRKWHKGGALPPVHPRHCCTLHVVQPLHIALIRTAYSYFLMKYFNFKYFAVKVDNFVFILCISGMNRK